MNYNHGNLIMHGKVSKFTCQRNDFHHFQVNWKRKKLVAHEIENDKQFIKKDKRQTLWISFNGSSIRYNIP